MLQTKFYIPPTRPQRVARPHLLERLGRSIAPGHKLTLVSAPAGFGKTTLVGEWIQAVRDTAMVAWLSLDEGDNDLNRFLTYFIAALNHVAEIEVPLGQDIVSALQSPQPPPCDVALTALINEMAALPTQVIVVLDNYHFIEARPIHDALAFLLKRLPPQLHLAIATREDPPLPLARLRARGQLTELRATDLRFTASEAAEFLNQVMGLSLSEEGVTALENRTEGWIVGLQLAALALQGARSMQNGQDTLGFIKSFTGSHRFVLDYLIEEVLEQQPEDIQTFLLYTAILERLCGSLCDAVTGQDNGQAILETLERANLFIVPLDDERHWYRYHPLFADMLRVRLGQKRPEQVRALHHRASAWFADTGDLDATIAHTMAARDFERALSLLAQHAEALWQRGEYVTLLKWLDKLGEDRLHSYPLLRIHFALASVMTGQFSIGAEHLQQLERELGGEIRPKEHETSLPLGMLAAGRAYLAYYQRHVCDMMKFARRALHHLPKQNTIWRGAIAVILGNAHNHDGNTAAACHAFAEALTAGREPGGQFLSLTAGAHLAITHVHQGQLRRAMAVCQEQIVSGRLSGMPVMGTLHAVWGDVLREWNNLREARNHIQMGYELCERGRSVAMLAWSCFAFVRLHFSERDFAAASQCLQRIEALMEPPVWVDVNLAAWKARIWLAQGRLALVERLLEERGLAKDDELSFLHMSEYISLARLLIADGIEQSNAASLADAVQLLMGLRDMSESGGWMGNLIQVLVLLALAYHGEGEEAQGMDTLNRALRLAEPEGFMRIFLDEGDRVIYMLQRAAARKDMSVYARHLLSAAEIGPEPAVPNLDPLSPRELEVLRLMADGLSNREIADLLFITTGTVKVHASNIYSKLGVSGRTQAATWARTLDLL